ncbi:cathepsin G-like [Pteronotus mesoamericanus]|uniref:cathepsin G-like n=1 Tax=Pteronotus mesoamericanus TaxID=1884717 RepID=UPI0023EB85AC|nr:cathepsin G-like [Pteronotus parnellii mesoamericanus]
MKPITPSEEWDCEPPSPHPTLPSSLGGLKVCHEETPAATAGPGSLPWEMQLLLVLVALLLPPAARAAEIIGGREAIPHSHPYMAYLLVETPPRQSFCGGFLVQDDFVMTAAHCWGSTIRVTLGAHNIRDFESTQQRLSVLRAIRHPGYNEQNNLNDIMLLQLQNRARQNRFVRPVALPQSRTRLRPGSQCTVAGWGLISENWRTDTLHDVQLRVQRGQVCSNLFDDYNDQRQICVGNQTDEKTTFRGDTGGPLVCNNVAQGIVSYGRSTGAPPTVFTRIARFLPWINNTLRQFEPMGSH